MELGQKRSLGNMVMDLEQTKIGQHEVVAKKEPWQHGGGATTKKELGQKIGQHGCASKKKKEKKKGPGHRELGQHTARANLVWTPEI